MIKMDLRLYSIMPLDTEHIEEICLDIKEQYETGVATCALFMMTLVPEGKPPVDKVGQLCRKYDLFRDRLLDMNLHSGILVQASIGHGWVLSEMFPFQPFVEFNTGKEDQIVCPYDKGFGEYIKNVFAVIAAHHPDEIMLDDDFRLMSARQGDGCGCELHLAEFNRRAGTVFSREELWQAVHTEGTEGDRYNRIMIDTQKDALISCARLMREGIDSVDPTIPGSFCCVGNNAECAAEIAEIIAGKNNPKVVRINNANYAPPGTKYFSNSFLRAAQSVSKLNGKVDVILAETDTCPQNRYSTGAMSLHTHFTGSLLEGVNGAKHWITRLCAFEPESGEAYRRLLGSHRGFYKTLSETVPRLRWRGFRIPTSDTPCFDYRRNNSGDNAWGSRVLERLGLPMYFSHEPGGIVCLEGDGDKQFSDAELKDILSGSVIISSDAAEHVLHRGFGEYLGVDVKKWDGKQPTREILPFRGNECSVQKDYRELIPLYDSTKELSTVYHSADKIHKQRLFPGVTAYRNSLGGTAFVFCGTPKADFGIGEIFSFLTYSRKRQLIDMMRSVNELPVFYPGDAEMYFRAADMDDGALFCAAFNLGFDPIKKLTLCADRKITEILHLTESGEYEPVDFLEKDGILTLDLKCNTLDPVILILRGLCK